MEFADYRGMGPVEHFDDFAVGAAAWL
jgi:hypothetical protein